MIQYDCRSEYKYSTIQYDSRSENEYSTTQYDCRFYLPANNAGGHRVTLPHLRQYHDKAVAKAKALALDQGRATDQRLHGPGILTTLNMCLLDLPEPGRGLEILWTAAYRAPRRPARVQGRLMVYPRRPA